MSADIEYFSNKASATEIAEHLSRCDASFVPPLSARVEINDYAGKIVSKAMRFEAWSGSTLAGLIAVYCNDREQRIAYITSVSVSRELSGKGIASCLMMQCIEYVKASGMAQISLEVASDNMPAIKLYEKNGFVAGKANAPFVTMNLYLKSGEKHEQQA
jgi:ribosomal protein S18 acetylase RimI-like enzyme